MLRDARLRVLLSMRLAQLSCWASEIQAPSILTLGCAPMPFAAIGFRAEPALWGWRN
jgi:hypothetical protein